MSDTLEPLKTSDKEQDRLLEGQREFLRHTVSSVKISQGLRQSFTESIDKAWDKDRLDQIYLVLRPYMATLPKATLTDPTIDQILAFELQDELAIAQNELTDSKRQLDKLQEQLTSSASKTELSNLQTKIDTIVKSVETAQNASNQLTAPILIPPSNAMSIKLVPTHWLEKLEEHRSDESNAGIFLGIFGGAAIGMFASLFTNSSTNAAITISISTSMFLGFLSLLTLITIIILLRLKNRASNVKSKMMDFSNPDIRAKDINKSPTEIETH